MITQTAEYALRAVVFIATSEHAVSGSEISEETHVPNDYLTKVLQELVRADIVHARRGPGGGYSLIPSLDELTVYDVVTPFAPVARIVQCPLGIEGHVNLCPLHRNLDEAAALVERAFKSTLIVDLIPGRRSIESCGFPLPSQ